MKASKTENSKEIMDLAKKYQLNEKGVCILEKYKNVDIWTVLLVLQITLIFIAVVYKMLTLYTFENIEYIFIRTYGIYNYAGMTEQTKNFIEYMTNMMRSTAFIISQPEKPMVFRPWDEWRQF